MDSSQASSFSDSTGSEHNRADYVSSVLASPLSIEEARRVHDKMMSYIFSTKQQLTAEEASVMGEFITRGIAIAFGVGATVTLVARGHPMTRRHPNLIGLAAGATADAMTRDYRRPRIYDRLLRLDTHLGSKARSMVMSMRTGEPEPTSVVNVSQKPPMVSPSIPRSDTDASSNTGEPVWWSAQSPEPQSSSSSPEQPIQQPTSVYGMGPPIELPKGGPFGGTRTWNEIRNSKNSSQTDNQS